MRVLETERKSSPHVNITAYIQPRGERERERVRARECERVQERARENEREKNPPTCHDVAYINTTKFT